ncbi:AraC family transcriptional regulator [Pseudomonas monteilii]|uniref:AraC family transcriptional regulator n=1 Tax=Pseudomonas monteilii TaxID=76759 RepID=UPI003CFC33CB
MDSSAPIDATRGQPGENLFTLALDLAGGTSIPTHQHAEGQLLFASTGVLAVTTNQGCWVVPSNHALWIPPQVAHRTRTIGASSIRTLYLGLNRAAALHSGCALIGVSSLLRELIVAALELKGKSAPGSRNAHLIDLLMDEFKAAPVNTMYLASPAGERLKPLCQEIFQNGTLNWGLAECATFLNVNMKTVQRWFLSDLGVSFGAWRKQARLLLALEWLALGKSILEVSLEAGYSSPSAFSAMFRKEFGMPPSALQMPQHPSP